ncbi:MAG: flagellar hook-length control protein FliK [Leptospiraceae bacterium]|nr:flagellar hook-length control protein FliK [Leptospiraceae bacterium]MCP5494536.1 flagellar hook-length control protein FliK [Leptospiraceae bacterium]
MIISNGLENHLPETFSQNTLIQNKVEYPDTTTESGFLAILKNLQKTTETGFEPGKLEKHLFSGFFAEPENKVREAENKGIQQGNPKKELESKIEKPEEGNKIVKQENKPEEKIEKSKNTDSKEKTLKEIEEENKEKSKKSDNFKKVSKETRLEFPEIKNETDKKVFTSNDKQNSEVNIAANVKGEQQGKQKSETKEETVSETKQNPSVSNKYSENIRQKFINIKLNNDSITIKNEKPIENPKFQTENDKQIELVAKKQLIENVENDPKQKDSKVTEKAAPEEKVVHIPKEEPLGNNKETLPNNSPKETIKSTEGKLTKDVPEEKDVTEPRSKPDNEPKIDLAKIDKDNKWEIVREKHESVVTQSMAAKESIQPTKQNNAQTGIFENINNSTINKIQDDFQGNNLDFSEFSNSSQKETFFDKFKNVLSSRFWNRDDVEKSFQELVKQARIHIIERGKNTAQILLHPKELGKMTLKIEVLNNRLDGKILVESEMVRNLILSDMNQLKTELRIAGIELESMDIGLQDENQEEFANFQESLKDKNEFANDQNSQVITIDEENLVESDLVDDKSLISSDKLIDIKV